MVIDGKALADTILSSLKKDVKQLSFIPTLAVILIGDDPASLAYIKQKQNAAATIGATVMFDHVQTCTKKDLLHKIHTYNADPAVHGIIIQRPIPKEVGDVDDVLTLVDPQKDVDGFLPNSPFEVPVALAVDEILTSIGQHAENKKIVVIGRGETAGKPIFQHIQNLNCTTSQLFSTSPNKKEILQQADIIISCVGKKQMITREDIKQGVILISVGIWRDSDGKLHGDYDEEDIKEIASWYTPTPRGVGPVNVSCLMQNLIKACKLNIVGTPI